MVLDSMGGWVGRKETVLNAALRDLFIFLKKGGGGVGSTTQPPTFSTPSVSSNSPSMAPKRKPWVSFSALFSLRKASYPVKVP